MSILARLAHTASQYLRRRGATAQRFRRPETVRPPGNARQLPGPPPRRVGGPGQAPPRQPPFTGRGSSDDGDEDEQFDDIELLGRDAGSDEEDFANLMSQMRQVSSSNVWGYAYQPETNRMGILYVTFLEYVPASAGRGGERTNNPGPTYAYYNFPLLKFQQFAAMAESTAGGAVWDYCRVRHSLHEHQHTYRLVQVSGEYVPRKVTAKGFKTRAVPALGTGRRGFRRSTLPPRTFATTTQIPNRAVPNRGTPNRGR